MTSQNKVFRALWNAMKRRYLERAVAGTDLAALLLHSRGRLHRTDTQLLAGEHPIDNNSELLTRITRATGFGISVFMGNRRVAGVSPLEAGTAPPVGGYADAVLVDTVLRKREVYRGELSHGSSSHLIAARPLFTTQTPDEYPVGMVTLFQDEQSLYEMLAVSMRLEDDDRQDSREDLADGIGNAINFLDDVARRLQLLALNGNIIAAQAGEQGRAFRVVCRELGTLADRAKVTVTGVRKLVTGLGLNTAESTDQ